MLRVLECEGNGNAGVVAVSISLWVVHVAHILYLVQMTC